MQLLEPESGHLESPFVKSKWDLVCAGDIAIRQGDPEYIWSASLYFARVIPTDAYRWLELSFFQPIGQRRHPYAPHSLEEMSQADVAVSNTLGIFQVAFGPVAIDDEDFDALAVRWGDLFAKGVNGQIRYPSGLPLSK